MPLVPQFVRKALKLAKLDEVVLGILTPDRDEHFAHFYFHRELREVIEALKAEQPLYAELVAKLDFLGSLSPPSIETWATQCPAAHQRLSNLQSEDLRVLFIGAGRGVEEPPMRVVELVINRLEECIQGHGLPRGEQMINDFLQCGRARLQEAEQHTFAELEKMKTKSFSPEALKELCDWFEYMEAPGED
jgi:hypothetical protein